MLQGQQRRGAGVPCGALPAGRSCTRRRSLAQEKGRCLTFPRAQLVSPASQLSLIHITEVRGLMGSAQAVRSVRSVNAARKPRGTFVQAPRSDALLHLLHKRLGLMCQ
ncbi:hypothetical protein NDU88_011310 [Pleurodeles waltl]|uniref:Uncharacterized protein n=1 Tax=Pleurodeles waltl TaxID=8319 RepID=A0AAV7S1U4_PLEWA|nr:hypothetical protein NDU88_011310 [Pleurodeles waltl]